MDITSLALALGSSLGAGLNLYLTVLALGLLDRFDVFQLPPELSVLSHPWVLIAAGVLFGVEFIADKIPYVDNAWDAVHGFIRVPAGALLAAGAVGDLPEHWLWTAGLLGGFVSLSAHGAKASARLAVNASPEPFSNWILSFAEDGISLGLVWLVTHHPWVALAVALAVLAVCLAVIFLFYRFFRLLLRGLSGFHRRHKAGAQS
ncbi:MAG: DUF4126 domain-containing protein [Acidobacteriota bacterium]